jgi:hypothetical protein
MNEKSKYTINFYSTIYISEEKIIKI